MGNLEEILSAEKIIADRYQPLMAVTQERLECECGALAIYVLLIQDDGKEKMVSVFFCQSCFEKAQEDDD